MNPRRLELENILNNDTIYHTELVELYYLRDLDLGLDPNEQIKWGINKLRNGYGPYKPLRNELLILINSSDNLQFYKECTFDELMYLGY